LTILPAGDVTGMHGKTYLFLGLDEIHGYRNYDIFEALAPDPTRQDVLQWITSYAGIRHNAGIPLYDMLLTGKGGDDLRMFFSWYGADYTTDAELAGDDVSPERRANPSMASWGDDGYLQQQRARLPLFKYRRLHLNLPGAPEGAAFPLEAVMDAIVAGRQRLAPVKGETYHGFVDMSGGARDDAVLCIAHKRGDDQIVIDLLVPQTGEPPFNPRRAVKKFVSLLKEYGCTRVTGDNYAGNTFKGDFEEDAIIYDMAERTRSELYEALEPRLTKGSVELLDDPTLQEQVLALSVSRSGKIDHPSGEHDDYANAVAGAVELAAGEGFDPAHWERVGAGLQQYQARLWGPRYSLR
jgi:hypothetical protein